MASPKKNKTFALLFLASEDTRPLALSFQSQQGDQTSSLERVATYKRRKAIEALSPNLGVHALGAVMWVIWYVGIYLEQEEDVDFPIGEI